MTRLLVVACAVVPVPWLNPALPYSMVHPCARGDAFQLRVTRSVVISSAMMPVTVGQSEVTKVTVSLQSPSTRVLPQSGRTVQL